MELFFFRSDFCLLLINSTLWTLNLIGKKGFESGRYLSFFPLQARHNPVFMKFKEKFITEEYRHCTEFRGTKTQWKRNTIMFTQLVSWSAHEKHEGREPVNFTAANFEPGRSHDGQCVQVYGTSCGKRRSKGIFIKYISDVVIEMPSSNTN